MSASDSVVVSLLFLAAFGFGFWGGTLAANNDDSNQSLWWVLLAALLVATFFLMFIAGLWQLILLGWANE